MNPQLEAFARKTIKEGLAKFTENHRWAFKQMYFHKDLNISIEDTVDRIKVDDLDWAMRQVQRTLEGLSGEGK